MSAFTKYPPEQGWPFGIEPDQIQSRSTPCLESRLASAPRMTTSLNHLSAGNRRELLLLRDTISRH
jgi:hypothetical protein